MQYKGSGIFISAVLLIAITLSIGLLYGHWYGNLVRERTEESKQNLEITEYCKNVALNFENVTFNLTIENTITMFIENTGSEDVYITGVKVYDIQGNEYIINKEIFLTKGDKKYYSFTVNAQALLEEIRIIIKGCNSISIPAEYIRQ